MASVPYVGSKISLITKAAIRYEGIFYGIDTKESTVALAEVRLLGTEGRPTERPYAPRDEIYKYIIFKASDILDICVCEPIKPPVGLPPDPAIVQHSPPVQCYPSVPLQSFGTFYGLGPLQNYSSQSGFPHIPSHQRHGEHSGGSSRSASATSQRKSSTSDAGVQVSVDSESDVQDPRIEARNRMRHRTREGMRNYQSQPRPMSAIRRPMNERNVPRRGRGRGSGPPGALRSIENLRFDNDYDFEQANAEFQELESKLAKNKIDESGDKSASEVEDADRKIYNRKESFFDYISCEATERMKGYDWRIERKLNVETFGASANNAWLRYRRGRGGYRRGSFRSRGAFTRSTETHKTVTFDEVVKEVPILEEVTVIEQKVENEEKKQEIPIIEITVVEKENDYPAESEAETVWK